MARYKYIDTQPKLLPVDLTRQLIPGTLEHAVHYLLDGRRIDLSAFDARFHNDQEGAPAYPPAMLLQVILIAYAHGVVSSRGIERLCQEHVTFIVLSGDTAPHFTTIAAFVSTLGDEIKRIFAAVVAICDAEGLIGREMFAIDGVKLPSNASKHRSGTRADFERQATKLEGAIGQILDRHRAADALPIEPSLAAKEQQRVARLEREAKKIRAWLAAHPEERRGPTGGKRKSNRTDNESAKMATGHGVIQGYTGVAAVDAKTQIIVEAQALGSGSEQEALLPMVDALRAPGPRHAAPLLGPMSLVTADAGYHSETNLAGLAERAVDGLIADGEMRQRDERFATQDQHRAKPDPLHDKTKPDPPHHTAEASRALPLYQPSDFTYDPAARTCVCPAGKSLYRRGAHRVSTNGYVAAHFRGTKRDCGPCPDRAKCLRHPAKTPVRNVAFFQQGRVVVPPPNHSARMRARIDSPAGRLEYGARLGTVEPVFANLCYNKGLGRFTLRGHAKVDAQWQLFCLVHNIEKLARHGYGQRPGITRE